ncbi:MAG: formate/nitrite transporter family protein [Eubacteriales bacterium]|nr:formate/nitrite transporter family protein [Clostridiales bacterium]MDY5837033.1 formate/nitrite transporter family protein [Eubacteriales bacterium]
MKNVQTFMKAIEAGICIALGGTVYLALDNKIVGSLLFTVGLFAICTRAYNLFTGKVSYYLDGTYSLLDLLLIWLGNLLGTWVFAQALHATRVGPALVAKAQSMCEVKLGDNLLSIFFLSVFCNMLIFLAVDGFSKNPHELGKYLALFFGVSVFILAGFEHCVANMFYVSVANMWSGHALVFILISTLGNAVGGLFFPTINKLIHEK